MCKKNFGRKQLSLLPDDDNIGDKINTDDDAVVVKTSKRKKRSNKKYEYCDTCDQNITLEKKRDSLSFKNTYHQEIAKEYCKDHISKHSDHSCIPHWCGDCSFLIKYIVEVSPIEQ